MQSPITGKEMVLIKERCKLSFRKEEFEVVYHNYKCEDSGESFTTNEIDELNLNQVYNQYRVKYNLPFPVEIKQIREKYGLSASKMAEVLGFGINSYRNYESGEVPSLSNARLIQLADDPNEFKKLINYSSAFEGKALENILKKIETIIKEEEFNLLNTQIENYLLETCSPNVFTGYSLPNFDKFTEMVVFFTEKMQPWKTKMNKLLFYADFVMYRKTGYSISGLQYRAIDLGPVPENFQSIFEYLVKNNDIEIYNMTFRNGGIGEQFKPNHKRSFNSEKFTAEELKVLEEVAARFKSFNTNRIINYSHKEKGWIENINEKRLIDYNYGFELQ
jgi:putative zinc finger/helix-turn-helix YgiT family protein